MTWFWQPLAPVGVGAITGTAALNVAQPTIAASGTVTPPPITGTASLSVAQPSVAATGVLKYSGSAALTVTAPSIGATGVLKYTGTASLAVPSPSIAGTGTVSGVGISGTAALSVPLPTIAGTGTVVAAAGPTGTGGPKPKRRRFVLDLPHRKPPEPERKRRVRRLPPIHAALSLTAPLPVFSVEAAVAELLPVTARLTLPRLALPSASWQVEVTNLLDLAHERVEELEVMLAAVVED